MKAKLRKILKKPVIIKKIWHDNHEKIPRKLRSQAYANRK
jgi:hypothetical protein